MQVAVSWSMLIEVTNQLSYRLGAPFRRVNRWWIDNQLVVVMVVMVVVVPWGFSLLQANIVVLQTPVKMGKRWCK